MREVREAIAVYGGQITVQLFSSLKKTGIEEAETVVGGWLAGCAADAASAEDALNLDQGEQ